MLELPIGIKPVKIAQILDGWSWLYKFDNGYGASVVLHSGSYGNDEGLYELLLTKADGSDHNWKHPDARFIESMQESEPEIGEDGLIGWLDLTDVARILGTVRGYDTPWRNPGYDGRR